MYEPRIDHGESFVHEDGRVRHDALADDIRWQSIDVILADCAEFRMFPEEVLQPPLIFDQLCEVLLRTEFPGHVSRCKKSLVTVDQRQTKGFLKAGNHLPNAEHAVDQVLALRRRNQAAASQLVLNVNSERGQA